MNSQTDSICKYIAHNQNGYLKTFNNSINKVVFNNQRIISVKSSDSNFIFDACDKSLTIFKPNYIKVYIHGKNEYPVIESNDTFIQLNNLTPTDTILKINIKGVEFYIYSRHGYAESLCFYLEDRFLQIQYDYNSADLYDINNFCDSSKYKRLIIYYGINGPKDIHYYSYVDTIGIYFVSKINNKSNKIKYIYTDRNLPHSNNIKTENFMIYSWRGKIKMKYKNTQINSSD